MIFNGKLAKEKRLQAGYSIKQMADRIGYSNQNCYRRLEELNASPSRDKVEKIAQLLKVSPDDLLICNVKRQKSIVTGGKQKMVIIEPGTLNRLKKELKWSTTEMALMADVSEGSFYLANRGEEVSLDIATKISYAFDRSVDSLFKTVTSEEERGESVSEVVAETMPEPKVVAEANLAPVEAAKTIPVSNVIDMKTARRKHDEKTAAKSQAINLDLGGKSVTITISIG